MRYSRFTLLRTLLATLLATLLTLLVASRVITITPPYIIYESAEADHIPLNF